MNPARAKAVLLVLGCGALIPPSLQLVRSLRHQATNAYALYLARFDGAKEFCKGERDVGYAGDAVRFPGMADDTHTGLIWAQYALMPAILTRDLVRARLVIANYHACSARDGFTDPRFELLQELGAGVAVFRRRS